MIELGKQQDIGEILNSINEAKKEMENDHNPQWSEDDYPNFKIPSDIEKENLYVYKEDNHIQGFIVIEKDKGEYERLVKTSKEPSYILHRLTIPKKYRHLGIAKKLIRFAEELATKNKIKVVKGDTEVSNTKMNNLFKKLGYIEKGTFIYEDYPGKYIYYEKEVGSDTHEI